MPDSQTVKIEISLSPNDISLKTQIAKYETVVVKDIEIRAQPRVYRVCYKDIALVERLKFRWSWFFGQIF